MLPRGGASSMIQIPQHELTRIRSHAHAVYPHECCGALLGRPAVEDDPNRKVVRVIPLENDRSDERERRYAIASGTVRELEAIATREGLEVVGFYHSHPDHPAEPSSFDLEHAWPWYSYVIVPVRAGAVGSVRGWRLADDRRGFEEELLTILEREQ